MATCKQLPIQSGMPFALVFTQLQNSDHG